MDNLIEKDAVGGRKERGFRITRQFYWMGPLTGIIQALLLTAGRTDPLSLSFSLSLSLPLIFLLLERTEPLLGNYLPSFPEA